MLRLVDRDAQLAALQHRWSRACAGAGGVTLLEGPVATGKTALLHTFGDLVEPASAWQLSATCSPAEQALPLGVASQLFLGPDLPPEFRSRTSALIETATTGTVQVLHELCRELLELATRTPLLIMVDDVQHADPLSTQWLLFLARRLTVAPVLLVLAGDLVANSGFAPTRAELLRLPHCASTPVAPLSDRAVTELVEQRCGRPTAARLSGTFFAASRGNPLLLNALLEDWRTGRETAGNSYQQALLDCLRRSGPCALRVAQGLALLEEPASATFLGTLLDLDPDLVSRIVHTLETAGLLANGMIAHEHGRAGLLADLPAPERASLHGNAAHLLHSHGAPATTVARHILAGPGGGNIATVLEAADAHLLADHIPAALDCLAHAVEHGTEARGVATARARLASVEWCVDPATAARHLTPLLAATQAGLLTVAQRIDLCRQLIWRGRVEEAATIVDQLPDTDAQVRSFRTWLACTHPRLWSPRTCEVTSGLRFSGILADVLLHGQSEQIVVRCEQLFQESQVHRDIRWPNDSPLVSLLPGVYAGALDATASWCDRWAAVAGNNPVLRAQLAAVSAEIAARQGDFAAATDRARTALDIVTPNAWGTAAGLPLGTLVLAAARTGDLGAAAEYLRLPVPQAMFESRSGLHYRYARGVYQLAKDKAHAAAADFLACGEQMRQWSIDTPGLVPWRIGLAQARLRLGQPEQAKTLLDEQLAGPQSVTVRGPALRLRAACAPPHRRISLLTTAADITENGPDRYELALVLTDLSYANEAAGEHRTARRIARRAWHVARSCAAEPICAELARSDTDQPDDDDPAPVLLSPAERRVATLASDGHSNRAIAAKLFVTESTVEQHLTKIYRKLKVRRREDLLANLLPDLRETPSSR
jgi:DNA-binding CsgD family transcriptional regulator